MLRIRADDPDARVPLGLKYGANLEDVPRLLQHAKGLGLKVRGGAKSLGLNVLPPQMREVHDGFVGWGQRKGRGGKSKGGAERKAQEVGDDGGRGGKDLVATGQVSARAMRS